MAQERDLENGRVEMHAPELQITYPSPNAEMGHRFTARVLSTKGREPQLFVRARDNRWYLQAPAHRASTNIFTGLCVLGFKDGPVGGVYTLVAGVPDAKVTSSPLDALPPGEYSLPVQVTRYAFDDTKPTGFDNPRED